VESCSTRAATKEHTTGRTGAEARTLHPRWVKAFIAVGVVLVVAFVILHLAGGGMGGHTP
jgi:hypothetical protein